MQTIIQVHKEGKFYVAVDLVTKVADQGVANRTPRLMSRLGQ